MSYRVESHVVVISDLTGAGNSIEARVFRIAPEFARRDWQEAKAVLIAMGANFEAAGSDATYLPGSKRLVVKNTLQQLDYIEKILNKAANRELKIPDILSPQNSPADPFAATPEKSDSDQLKQGYGYFDLGQYNEAMEAFNKVLAVDPQNVSARR